MDKKLSPFDFLSDLNYDKKNLIVDDITEKQYTPFMVNRGLSYFNDSISAANIMNQYHHLDKKLQNDFLINILRKRKRFSKWEKQKLDNDIEVVKEYYGYSNEKAKQILDLLSKEQLQIIKQKVDKGGRKK